MSGLNNLDMCIYTSTPANVQKSSGLSAFMNMAVALAAGSLTFPHPASFKLTQ